MTRRKNKRELLQQLHKLEIRGDGFRQLVAGQLASRKLDGLRGWWDGGLTRGMFTTDVPWANTEKDTKTFISTGLWSRFGKSIQAPDWWLDHLPARMLDGEFYAGRGRFKFVQSAVRKHVPIDSEWEGIEYHIFDSPSIEQVTQPGRIKIRYWETYAEPWWHKWIQNRRKKVQIEDHGAIMFGRFVESFTEYENDIITVVPQVQLPFGRKRAEVALLNLFDDEVGQGGEGIVVREPSSIWTPYRSHDVLKLKKEHDEEGTVVGYTSGREGVEGLRLGRIGAIWVRNGDQVECKVAGLNESETEIVDDTTREWAIARPDSRLPAAYDHPQFPLGSQITYTYFEKSPDNVPLQPRYLRPR